MEKHTKQYDGLDNGTFGGSKVFHKIAEFLSATENFHYIRKVAKHLNGFSKDMMEISQTNISKGLKIHLITLVTQEKLKVIKKGFPNPFLNSHMQNAVITRKRDTIRKLK